MPTGVYVRKKYPRSEKQQAAARRNLEKAWKRAGAPDIRERRAIAMTGAGNPFFGKTHTPASIEKMRAAKRGTPPSALSVALARERFLTSNPAKTARVREILRQQKLGAGNPQWRGGITDINAKIRNSPEYAEWRRKVFERDAYRCQVCGIPGSRRNPLNADHIKPFSIFPALRFKLSNGRTLCEPCHFKTDTFGSKILRLKKDSLARQEVERRLKRQAKRQQQ